MTSGRLEIVDRQIEQPVGLELLNLMQCGVVFVRVVSVVRVVADVEAREPLPTTLERPRYRRARRLDHRVARQMAEAAVQVPLAEVAGVVAGVVELVRESALCR